MAEEQQVDDMPDVSLIDNDIAPPSDAQPSETPATQATDDGADTQEEQTTEETSPSEGEQQPAQEEQPQQQDDEAAIKARNEAYARQRIQERQRTKQAVAQQIEESYGPKTKEELMEEGLDEYEARIAAIEQRSEFREQQARIAELNAGMQAEAVNISNDFPVFDPNSKDYDPEFAGIVEQQYKQAARLQLDDNGIVVNAEVPLYDFYSQMATIYNRGTSRGQQQGQQEAQQMLSRTENPGGSSSTTTSNSLEDLEARLADVVIT